MSEHSDREHNLLPSRPQFFTFSHDEWAALAQSTPLPLTEYDISRLSALGDPISLSEADAIYRPLSALLQMYTAQVGSLQEQTSKFLALNEKRTPFVIAIAGSVAVGKSTTARLLQELLRRWPATPRVSLVTTDGFLYPNAELERRGLMNRKGFPESYDQQALYEFVRDVKAGNEQVHAPLYDHVTYDVVAGEYITLNHPDILILEGLNVLAPPDLSLTEREYQGLSDLFDLSIYVDAQPQDLERWYMERIFKLRDTAFTNPNSYFRRWAEASEAEIVEHFGEIWRSINLVNLVENIAPTRSRANIVLSKGSDHRIEQVSVRKL
ncbi:MAG: type I pantothenate kinase [Actinomycetaceae bacterium]|nr:type I pantothenate kinase [Actinomycetaceae bacterium]